MFEYIQAGTGILFLSTLSLRRATVGASQGADFGHISIHALLAESDRITKQHFNNLPKFLSTLSLRRATSLAYPDMIICTFLSTLSLRRATPATMHTWRKVNPFLSTLSLRRATCRTEWKTYLDKFLSTLSLRRATCVC